MFLCIPLWQTAGKSRIDFNDCFELVKYPMIFSKDILDGLSAAGVDMVGTASKPMFKAESKGDAVETAIDILQHVAYCQSQTLYVSFQIAFDGTHKQYNLCCSRKAVSKLTRKAAFQNAGVGRKSPSCNI
jgi:hypothetical protein